MLRVNAADNQHRLADWLRNLFYPLIPVVAVGTIWAIAWARSLESRIAAECRPLGSDYEGNFIGLRAPQRLRLPADPPRNAVASDDD